MINKQYNCSYLKFLFLSFIFIFSSCKEESTKNSRETIQKYLIKNTQPIELYKIPVLNLGTFHMGATYDVVSEEFDSRDYENRKRIHQIAEKLSAFKPTVIIVEKIPDFNDILMSKYTEYTNNPEMIFENPTEVELLAFELGRISGTKRIYGIDTMVRYNYLIDSEIENSLDSITYNTYEENPLKYHSIDNDIDSFDDVYEKLKMINQNEYLDHLIQYNADIFTHVGTENGYEGADEASKYYQRNLRMYSNLNRIKLTNEDRVFILLGGTHTAFFRDFISRSPKYELVDTFKYLK